MKLNATIGLIAAMVLGFIVVWSPGTEQFVDWMACDGGFTKPWAYLTYPFFGFGLGIGLFFLVFQWIWFYFVGSQVEARLGWQRFLALFGIYSVLSGALVVGTMKAVLGMAAFTGAWLPISALTCYWAAQNPGLQVCWMGILRLNARWLAVLTAVFDFFTFGHGMPLVGVMAVVSCGAAFVHGSGFRFSTKKKPVVSGRGNRAQSQKEFEGFIDKVRTREKERDERERLRRLFESSVEDGDDGPVEPRE